MFDYYKGKIMKWNYGNPITDGPYLCAVKGCSYPLLLYWQNSLTTSYWSDNTNTWTYPQKYDVIYYMNLNDIPMPEGW
jgi:hypothetical protein